MGGSGLVRQPGPNDCVQGHALSADFGVGIAELHKATSRPPLAQRLSRREAPQPLSLKVVNLSLEKCRVHTHALHEKAGARKPEGVRE